MDFTEWANVAGGISGLLTFAYVAYEKATKKPKILLEILEYSLREARPDQWNPTFRYFFDIKVEIGNVGTELTTIVRSELQLFQPKHSYELRYKNRSGIADFGDLTVVMKPGFAGSYSFYFPIHFDSKIQSENIKAQIKLKLIGGKVITSPLDFKVVRDDRVL